MNNKVTLPTSKLQAQVVSTTQENNSLVKESLMDELGWTPLLYAVFFGCTELVEELIGKGADVNEKGRCGVTPLHKATIFGAHIIGVYDDKSIEITELIIANGADVNAKDEDGLTPLMYAVLEGHKESAKMLIMKGANLNAKDEDGETALHYAASFGQNEIFELLVNNGANLNVKDNRGRTPVDRVDDGCKSTDLLSKNGTMEGGMRVQPEHIQS